MNGRTLLARSLEAIISSGVATTIVVAAPEDFLLRAREEIAEVSVGRKCEISITAVAGGNDRISTVQRALKLTGDAEYVLVHDAARCLTPPDVFTRVVAGLRSGAQAVIPVLPMIDTVRRAVSEPAVRADTNTGAVADRTSNGIVWSIHGGSDADITADRPNNSDPARAEGAGPCETVRGDLDRSELRRVQTPQGFRTEVLLRAYERFANDGAEEAASAAPTDDAGLVERLGVDVLAVEGDEEALKITYPLDLTLAEQLARIRDGAVAPGPGEPDSAKEPR